MERAAVPKATLGRLPDYLNYLKGFKKCKDGKDYISATAIARSLDLGEVQVRKDLSAVSGAGKPKIGYEITELIKSLEDVLGQNRLTNAVLVGTGKLGKALLQYDEFKDYGVQIIAGFDTDESVITEKCPKPVYSMKSFDNFCKTQNVQIGIITVDAPSAQNVCNQMIDTGIEAIWNFAPCELTVPQGILVKQEKLALSLAYLKTRLSN